jgi:hypothetical protein
VKQKTRASADFLGVLALRREVVGRCCIPTTNLTLKVEQNRRFSPLFRRLRAQQVPILNLERTNRFGSGMWITRKILRLKEQGRCEERSGLVLRSAVAS